MTPKLIVTIEIGTRTTLVHVLNVAQRKDYLMKLKGDDTRIPSCYRESSTELLSYADLHDLGTSADVIANFKIEFWKSSVPSEAQQTALRGWLVRLAFKLRAEF